MNTNEIFPAVLVDDEELDAERFAEACGVTLEWVSVHVDAGVLAPSREDTEDRRFAGAEIRRARLINALERDFNALPELAALVVDLQDEVARLRGLVRRRG